MKLNKILFFTAALSAAASLSAAPSFSGSIGGSAVANIGVPLDGADADWTLPLCGYAAAQANLAEWAIFRGEVGVCAPDFNFDDVFSQTNAVIRLNELSFVFQRRAYTATNYLSAFLGSYEQIGSDAFLTRHFGIEPVNSRICKSYASLTYSPLRSTKEAGISYIVNFDKAPIATGGYFYFSKDKNDSWTMNLDARFAMVTNFATVDLLLGVGTPFQNSNKNTDAVLVIDTITLHGGITTRFGTKFGHELFIQFGFDDISVRGDGAGEISGDELSIIMEPRIRLEKFRFAISAYSLNQKRLEELFYLNDPFGVALNFYKDDIEGKRGDITLGIFATFSVSGTDLYNFAKGKTTDNAIYNVYATPYAELPLSAAAKFEAMAQIGVLDVSGTQSLNFKLGVAAKTSF